MKQDAPRTTAQEENGTSTLTASAVKETSSELGVIKIHDNVLAALIGRAVLGVDGVVRLAGSALVDGLVGMVGNHSRAIEIAKDEDDKTEISVKLVLRFGTVIPEVALAVQRAVIEEVEHSAGITVTGVNIIVQQLEDPREPSESNGAADAVLATMGTLG